VSQAMTPNENNKNIRYTMKPDTDRKADLENVQNIRTSKLRYHRLFEAAQDGILLLDAETGMIMDVNPFLVKLLGYTREEFVEKRLWEVGAFKDIEASQEAFKALKKNEYIRYEDLPLKAKDGRLIQVEFVSNVYLVGSEKVIQCNIRDITDRKQAQDALLKSQALLREQSVRDHLTGLFNRRFMEKTLERELLRASRKGLSLGIMMLDVDHFKRFNDTWGHAAGDKILRELGKLLLRQVRGVDIASRYGGDEFVIILPNASREVTLERAKRLCEHTRRLKTHFKGQIFEMITFSVGVAASPANGTTCEEILKAADTALYLAKHEGRGPVVVANQ
jgi:diguanylate cyclase (GGDEF)-like protein/PAS domain S-box-containing protein